LQTINKLPAVHGAINRILIRSDRSVSSFVNRTHNQSIKHRQTCIKRGLSSSSTYSKTTGKHPISVFISSLHTGYERSGCRTFIIACSFRKQRESGINYTCLVSTLTIQRKVKAIRWQKSQTGRVIIYTVDINRSPTGYHTKKTNMLICICQETSCKS
jgi:hypothetical protein